MRQLGCWLLAGTVGMAWTVGILSRTAGMLWVEKLDAELDSVEMLAGTVGMLSRTT